MFLPPETTLGVLAAMQFENLFYIYLGIPFVIGISLTCMASAARTKAASIVTVVALTIPSASLPTGVASPASTQRHVTEM